MKSFNCQLPSHVERTSDMSHFLEEARSRIEEIYYSKGVCITTLDGIPGAGKSTLLREIRKKYTDMNPIIYGMDNHLITARNTPEREMLTEGSEDYFVKNYCDDEAARRVVNELLETDQDFVQPGRVYTRATGGHIIGKAIPIPDADKRLVIFEGTGAIQICKELREDVINLLVYADPETAIQAKIYRDKQKGEEPREAFHRIDNYRAYKFRLRPTLEDEELCKTIYALDNTEALAASTAA